MTSLVNIAGLSLGICISLAIYLILDFEFSFENLSPGKNRIYRVVNNRNYADGRNTKITNLPFSAKEAIEKEVTGLEKTIGFHVFDFYGEATNIPGDNIKSKSYFSRCDIVVASGDYFSIFPTIVLAGSNRLLQPYQVVLTLEKAEKYFGKQAPSLYIGKKIIYGDSLMVTVTGIINNWPKNTDFGFKDFISESSSESRFLKDKMIRDDWRSESEMVFVKLNDDLSNNRVTAQLGDLGRKYFPQSAEAKDHLILQPLSAIHFSTEYNYDYEFPLVKVYKPTLYALSGIALFILLIAAINFINLATARAMSRAKEIGIRKIIGSTRRDLVMQLLIETFIITAVSVLISLSLVIPVMSFFKSYIPEGVYLNLFNPGLYLFLLIITVTTTLLSGLYPALKLASLAPIVSLRGADFHQPNSISKYFRRALIIFQFTISLCFIIGAVIMGSQLNYIVKKGPGFKTDAILTFYAGERNVTNNKIKTFSERIKQLTGIKDVALQSFDPISMVHLDIQLSYKDKEERELKTAIQYGNENFITLYEIPIIAGRNFLPKDSSNKFILNRSSARLLGFTKVEDAIGKNIYYGDKPSIVVGVVEDFHENSFYEPIRPIVIKNDLSQEQTIAVKLDVKGKNSGTIHSALSRIEAVWRDYYPGRDFTYSFLDDSIAAMYKKERNTSELINTSVLITILISCMGLFGLSVFIVQQKTKEIGIRKVLGASPLNIMNILSRDFVYLILISSIIASPITWYFMNKWMDNFAYHISISWWMFVLSSLGAIFIALITISFQGIKAALANPVDSIRN